MTGRPLPIRNIYDVVEQAFRVETDPDKDSRLVRSRIDREVGKRIHVLRTSRGLTLDGVASSLQLTAEQMENFESGLKRIGAARLSRLAKILDVSPAEFFPPIEDLVERAGPESGVFSSDYLLRSLKEAVEGIVRAAGNPPTSATVSSVPFEIAISKVDWEQAWLKRRGLTQVKLATSLAQIVEDDEFDRRLRSAIRDNYPSSKVFAFSLDFESASVDAGGRFLASGEALLSVPTKNRRGQTIDASLSLPIRVTGIQTAKGPARWELVQLAPVEAHYPPDLALRLNSGRSPRRPPAAEPPRSVVRRNRSPARRPV